MLKRGLNPDQVQVETANYRYSSGYEAAKRILNQEKIPTAILCFNDEMAFAAKAADRQIPIYLTGCRSDTLDYDTVKQWHALRVQPLYDIAPIAAYCKSWIQVSIGKSAKLI